MTGRAMSAGTVETQSGSGRQPASAVASGDGPQTTDNRENIVTTSEQQAVPVAQIDWGLIAKAAGEHGVRYRTTTALLAFLDAIEPARKADRFDPALPCKSGEGAEAIAAGQVVLEGRGDGTYAEAERAIRGLIALVTQRQAGGDRIAVAKALARHPDSSWDDYEWEDMASFVRERFLEQADLAIAALTPDATQTREAELVRAVKDDLRGSEGEEYTDSGMEDAFFRWPVVERALRAALNARGGA